MLHEFGIIVLTRLGNPRDTGTLVLVVLESCEVENVWFRGTSGGSGCGNMMVVFRRCEGSL